MAVPCMKPPVSIFSSIRSDRYRWLQAGDSHGANLALQAITCVPPTCWHFIRVPSVYSLGCAAVNREQLG